MTKEEFEQLKPGDLIGWTIAGYTRVYDVLAAPVKTKKGLMLRARCRIYGEHELYPDDVLNWKKNP